MGVHPLVGLGNQFFPVVAVEWVAGPAVGGRDAVVQPVGEFELEFLGDFRNPVSKHFHAVRIGVAGNDEELVPTQPDHGIGVARAGLKDLGKAEQCLISNVMIPCVIDLLEVIEIEQEKSKCTAALCMLSPLYMDHSAVSESGKGIGECFELGSLEGF